MVTSTTVGAVLGALLGCLCLCVAAGVLLCRHRARQRRLPLDRPNAALDLRLSQDRASCRQTRHLNDDPPPIVVQVDLPPPVDPPLTADEEVSGVATPLEVLMGKDSPPYLSQRHSN